MLRRKTYEMRRVPFRLGERVVAHGLAGIQNINGRAAVEWIEIHEG